MKKNNSKKPFFNEDKKDSKSFKGGFKKKSTDSDFEKSSSGHRSSGKKDDSFSKSSFGKKPGFAAKKPGFKPKFDKGDSENKFGKSEGTGSVNKKFFQTKADASTGRNRSKADDSDKRSSGRGDARPVKPYSKEFKSDKPSGKGEGLIYRGRGKDQKPVFEPGKPVYKKDKTEVRGFGNKRFVDQDTTLERPDYKFDALPSKKKKMDEASEGLIRLNKFISNSGICGRREADQLIAQGMITLNGEICTEMGRKVKRTDRVVYQGRKINPEKPVYVLLNKPKDFITTTDDPMDRKTVMNLVGNACEERIFPVGRLDRNTTGLLLFTNDGELAAKLSHPSNEIKKIYQVTLDKPLSKKDEEAIIEGLTLEDGPAAVDDLQVLSGDRKIMGMEIHIGRNRIVRRIFAHLDYEVTALDRVTYAGLDKKDLKRGHYRFLSEQEVIRLKFFI
jgi:23S rRNA pseudouridine2605 synthase